MVEVTLFELNLDGAEFTANAPNSGGGDEESDDGAGGPGLGLVALAGVILVGVAIAALAVKKRGGDGDETDRG